MIVFKSSSCKLQTSHDALIIVKRCRHHIMLHVCKFIRYDIAIDVFLKLLADEREQLLLVHDTAA